MFCSHLALDIWLLPCGDCERRKLWWIKCYYNIVCSVLFSHLYAHDLQIYSICIKDISVWEINVMSKCYIKWLKSRNSLLFRTLKYAIFLSVYLDYEERSTLSSFLLSFLLWNIPQTKYTWSLTFHLQRQNTFYSQHTRMKDCIIL